MSESTTSDTLTPEQQFEEDIALVLKNAIELHHQGDFENARALYEAIVDAKPDHADAQYDLGVLKVQIGRAADALPHFEIALGGAPNNGQYWVSYVNALIDAGQIAAAWTALGLCQQRGVRGPAVDGLILRLAHSEEGKPAY
ncbi:tetratricopeptide repeat protein, partial [Burkholderia pseudomallei]